jgi:hypothetical protein
MLNRYDIHTPGSPGAPLARPRGAILGVALALALGALPWASASAQVGRPPAPAPGIQDENGNMIPLSRPRGFNMFSEADVAVAGMRMTGILGWMTANVGPVCPVYAYASVSNNSERCGLIFTDAGTNQLFFQFGFAAGVPISDYRKIRQVYPGVGAMQAPAGYSVAYRYTLTTPELRKWGAADGQFGNLFAGTLSTADGSCTDFTSTLNGLVPANLSLTAASDCPQTWANNTFAGERLVTAETFLSRAQSNALGFRFDTWKVPASDKGASLGDFATYGVTSDYYRELLQRYGSVTPQGSGNSSERGFPMGLEIRYDAWQYTRPSIRNVVWYQMTIVNKSAQVYGTGVDYDSLYLSLAPGHLNSTSGSQTMAWYFDMDRNAVLATGHNTSGNCTTTYPKRVPGITVGCPVFRGFTDGAVAFVILKSPLGDTRNKLFSRASSPFSQVAVPESIKDDTITFNHARYSAFGQHQNHHARNDRAFFGYMAGIEEVFLDGRAPAEVGNVTDIYRTFPNENWRNYTGTLGPQFTRFPRFVPGSSVQPNTPQHQGGQPYGQWDYNNDGIQDTIMVPGCGSNGCHDTYSDTLVSGLHNRFGNITNLIGMGPVKLKAGDTTQILLAVVGGANLLGFESAINATIDTYMNFYAGPAAIAAPQLAQSDVQVTPAAERDITVGAATARVDLRIPQLNSSADPFVQRVADQLATSNDPTVARLRKLNPNLVEQVKARARNNLAEILVFKSCDRGATFTTETYNRTSGAGCRPSPATNATGEDIGFGWQPFAIIPVDTANRPATQFIVDVVQAGRSYLYSFVTRTRGLIDIPIVDSAIVKIVGTDTTRAVIPTNLAKALNLDADTIVGSLARSGPTTVTVYAPISLPAGTQAAVLDTSLISGTSTIRVTAAQTGGTLESGEYRLFFANRFIVETQQEVASGRILQTTVTAQRVVKGSTANGTTRNAETVAAQAVFTAPGQVYASSDTLFPKTVDRTENGIRYYRDVINPATLGYVLTRVGTGARALFVSSTTAAPRTSFQTLPFFPGFQLTFDQAGGGLLRDANVVLRANGDTVNSTVVSNNAPRFLTAGTVSQYYGTGGEIRVTWSDDAFGPNSNFLYQTSQQLRTDVAASLAARTNVSATEATDDIRKLVAPVAAAASVDTLRPLTVFQLPFRVIGANGQQARVAQFQRFRTATPNDTILNSSRLLGNGGDTLRVRVPNNLWVPGDTLWVVEVVKRDSTVTINDTATTVLSTQTIGGREVLAPVQVSDTIVTARLILNCGAGNVAPITTAAPRCNPIVPNTFGASGYLPFESGWTSVLDFTRNFELFSEIAIDAQAPTAVGVQLVQSDLNDIRVVPNPYIVQSNFDDISTGRVGTPRVLFTGVPVQGRIRVYSISGQLIQQTTWNESDLENIGQGRLTGDLPFVLRSREGLDMGSGLYVFVLESTGTGAKLTKRGKFVIIR